MDTSASGAAEHRSRRRTAHLLTGALPGWVLPPVGQPRSSHRGSHPHSRSSKHKCCSVGSSPCQGPSSPQAAILEERIKTELEHVHRLNNQERLADTAYKLLYNRAREGTGQGPKVLARQLEIEQHLRSPSLVLRCFPGAGYLSCSL